MILFCSSCPKKSTIPPCLLLFSQGAPRGENKAVDWPQRVSSAKTAIVTKIARDRANRPPLIVSSVLKPYDASNKRQNRDGGRPLRGERRYPTRGAWSHMKL